MVLFVIYYVDITFSNSVYKIEEMLYCNSLFKMPLSFSR